MELVSRLLHARERDEHSVSVFLDLSKVFDTLNHSVLLLKLDQLGIRGVTNKWFGDYLTGKSLVAKITVSENRTVYSEPHQITYGTHRAAVLDPYYLYYSAMTFTNCTCVVTSFYLLMTIP